MEVLATLKISSVGQVTLPSAIRKRMGVGFGDEIDIVGDGEELLLRRPETLEENIERVSRELDELKQALPNEVKQNIQKHAGWTASQYREYYGALPEARERVRAKYGL